MKATAIAPANIAFIKYWGVKDPELRLPANGSLSMNLSNLLTTTTVEFDDSLNGDLIIINGKQEVKEGNRVSKHLDRIRKLAKIRTGARVVSKNTFPASTGLSSSASGFAALTVAAVKASGLNFSEKELTILARQGSGSACRSIPDGFVEWLAGDTSETSFADSLYPPDYWDIMDIVVIVSSGKKEVSSTEGHSLAETSPFFATRLAIHTEKMRSLKQFLQEKNFPAFGELIEAEALELHAIYLTSNPSLIYLLPESLQIMRLVKKWRQEGLPVYFSLNTGQDVHLICRHSDAQSVKRLLENVPEIKSIIENYPSTGARVIKDHLF